MEDMIKKIVDIDEQARHLTDDAQQVNINMMDEVTKKRNKLRDEYLSRAKVRVEKIKLEEEKKTEVILQGIKNDIDKKSATLDEIYSNRSDEWIKSIFDRVIGE